VILSRHENEATEFTLSAKNRAELEKIVGDGNAAQKVAKRAKIVLMTAAGAGVMAIAIYVVAIFGVLSLADYLLSAQ
jgi:hypothetical protein